MIVENNSYLIYTFQSYLSWNLLIEIVEEELVSLSVV